MLIYLPNYIDKKGVDSEIRGFEKLNDWCFLLLPRVQLPFFYQGFCDLFILKLSVIDPRHQFVLGHRLINPPLDNKPWRRLGDDPKINSKCLSHIGNWALSPYWHMTIILLYVVDINLLVTSEDRDDGRAAYHGQIPPGGQCHGQPGHCQRGKCVGSHNLRLVNS